MATFKTTHSIEEGVDLNALTQIYIGQVDVNTTATQIATGAPADRKSVAIKNLIDNTENVYIGPNIAVLTSTGWELAPGESIVFDVDESQDFWAITSSGTQRVCWTHIK